MTPDMPADFARLLDDPASAVEEFRVNKWRLHLQTGTGILLLVAGTAFVLRIVLQGLTAPTNLLIVSIFLCPAGAYVLWKALTLRHTAVLLFPSLGFLYIHRKGIDTCRWREIITLAIGFVVKETQFADGNGNVELPFERQPVSNLDLALDRLIVRLAGGKAVVLTSLLEKFDRLSSVLQEETLPTFYSAQKALYDKGERLTFGTITIDRNGIQAPKKEPLSCGEMHKIRLKDGFWEVYKDSRSQLWNSAPIFTIDNPHVLARLVEYARGLAR